MLRPWNLNSGCTLEPSGESRQNPTPVHIDGHRKLEAALWHGHELRVKSLSQKLGSNVELSPLNFNSSGALDSGCMFWGDLKMSSCTLYRLNQKFWEMGGGAGEGTRHRYFFEIPRMLPKCGPT